MKYDQVWAAVDKLAKMNGLSSSGLAKKAGLDATTFNKSKRMRPDGKRRWPSLDSLNKIIEVCNISFDEFYRLIDDENEAGITHSIPYIECSRLLNGEKNIYSDFRQNKWNKIRFPEGTDNLYALDINSDKFAPFYRNGTLLIISQESEVRCGDRVVIYLNNRDIIICEFIRRTASTLELKDLLGTENISIAIGETQLIHRIVWASQ